MFVRILLSFFVILPTIARGFNDETIVGKADYSQTLLYSINDEMTETKTDKVFGDGRVVIEGKIRNRGGISKRILTQDMFYKENSREGITNKNTVFCIKYDFSLEDNITIPENSVLEFDGGSISGKYTITGNCTTLRGAVSFSPEVSFNGSYNNIPTVYVDWFVGEYVANTDCSDGIRSAIALARLSHTSLSFGGNVTDNVRKYYCSSGEFDISDLVINGNGSTIMGIGDYNMFIVDGGCHIKDLQIGKYPYQDGTSKGFRNAAVICRNNHHMIFENVSVDGFHYGFLLDSAWNVVIDACNTFRCSVGVGGKGLSVNNNIHNSRISGTVCGIDVKGVSEGWMISDNVIIGSTGLRFTNHANTIIKGNIVDLCSKYAMEIIGNCPGMLIDNNYMAIEKGGESIILISSQDIKNNEDQMISITNNILRGYDSMKGETGISITSGKYKHIKIMGNHIKSNDLKYGISIDKDVSIGTLFIRDNVVEGKENIPPVRIQGKITNRFISDNVKTRL